MLRSLGCAFALAFTACGPVASSSSHPTQTKPPPHVSSQPSARSVLAAYLDLTFAGRHERAYGYLSSDDRSHLSRGAYIDQESANDRVRNQMRALGPVSYHIAGIREKGDQASAMVTVRTGLGTDRLRFVLHRERERWSVVYSESWSQDQ
ncbi:MAG TPA: hypothetical protein VL856_02620 [Acidimicrobiia bacterium]|nr:hypothetical protein [Acidimicrobiia bacterium]